MTLKSFDLLLMNVASLWSVGPLYTRFPSPPSSLSLSRFLSLSLLFSLSLRFLSPSLSLNSNPEGRKGVKTTETDALGPLNRRSLNRVRLPKFVLRPFLLSFCRSFTQTTNFRQAASSSFPHGYGTSYPLPRITV